MQSWPWGDVDRQVPGVHCVASRACLAASIANDRPHLIKKKIVPIYDTQGCPLAAHITFSEAFHELTWIMLDAED